MPMITYIYFGNGYLIDQALYRDASLFPSVWVREGGRNEPKENLIPPVHSEINRLLARRAEERKLARADRINTHFSVTAG